MHILPSLKTFRLFLIALLAVALTGGIAFFNSSPAAATVSPPSVSMEVFAAQSGLGTFAEDSPVYLTGQGLRKGSPFTFDLFSLNCEHVNGSSSLKISNRTANVSLRLPDFSSASGCSISATLIAEFDPALWPACDATHVIMATVRTVMETTADGKVQASSTTSGVVCEPVYLDSDWPEVDMGSIRALQRAIRPLEMSIPQLTRRVILRAELPPIAMKLPAITSTTITIGSAGRTPEDSRYLASAAEGSITTQPGFQTRPIKRTF